MPKPVLTAANKSFIRENYLQVSSKVMARYIGCSPTAVQRFMKRNGLVVPRELQLRFRSAGMYGRTTFTAEEDDRIRREYLDKPIKTLADEMGRSYTGIMHRLKHMGLQIPLEIIQRNKESARIKKGNVPLNKGKKQAEYMSPEMIERTKATRFKKGNIPPNAKDRDGVITIRHKHSERGGGRSYKYIRVALGKWIPYHKYLWEKANGKVPKGHCLWFKDDNTMNVALSNLELITRKENYARNHPAKRLGDKFVARCLVGKNGDPSLIMDQPDLLNLKRQQLKLNRIINNETNADRK